MPDIARQKAELRIAAATRREALDPEWRAEAALAIALRVEMLLRFEPDTIVGAYLPIRSEVDPRLAMARLVDRGAHIAVPAIVSGELEFRRLSDDAVLEPQGFGTHAPQGVEVHPTILLVPLLAFDPAGRRIGYGKGFYDRAITRLRTRHPGFRTVGLAFSAQQVAEVPVHHDDRHLDAIVTENATLVPNADLFPAASPSGAPEAHQRSAQNSFDRP